MNEPIKPSYSDNEIQEMNDKLEEQDRLLNDSNARNEYLRNNLSSKANTIVIIEGVINGLFYASAAIVFVLATYWMLFTVLDIQKYDNIGDIVLMAIASLTAGYFIMSFSLIVLSPIFEIVKSLFNPIYKEYENEKNQIIEKYQLNISKRYEKYMKMKQEINNYNKKMYEYREYCKRIDEAFWYSLDGHTFEQEIAKLFKKDGYHASVSKVGADGGVDIVLTKNGKKYAVQCKAHSKKISEGVARDLYGVLHAKNYDGGYLVTLNGVSSKTYQFCKTRKDKPIIIWTIKTILKKYSE